MESLHESKMITRLVITCLFLLSCSYSMSQPNFSAKSGLIYLHMSFFNSRGDTTLSDLLRVWYKDSAVIQEIHRTKRATDTANRTTVSYEVMRYRYIHLPSRTSYDYKTFSDTSRIIHKAALPDTVMRDYGWSFYSEEVPRIKGIPVVLSDTIIGNIVFKRARFNFFYDDPEKRFIIGYFNCENPTSMFSLERSYSRKINCTMTKFFEFTYGVEKPFFSREIELISDTLSATELKVFDAWKRNARQNPVTK